MKEYNPKIEDGWRITGCPVHLGSPGFCGATPGLLCPTETETPAIPPKCPARSEGFLTKVIDSNSMGGHNNGN
jgi:hypothetical protein